MLEEVRVNEALQAEDEYKTAVEVAYDYVENFDILETITNVGNDEVFTPRKTADMMLDSLPGEVWHNPNYKWLNPATKNGIFEREIAIRLDKKFASHPRGLTWNGVSILIKPPNSLILCSTSTTSTEYC